MTNTIVKPIIFLKKQKVQFCLSIFLFILLFGFNCFLATKGIDLTDEGMYISSAMRYSLGDKPFKDEIINTMRSFDILTSSIFFIFPDLSLFEFRCIGLGFRLVSLFVLFFFLTRFAPSIVVAIPISIGFIISNPYNLFSPSYKTISTDLATIALTIWMLALVVETRLRRIVFSSFAGLFYSMAVFTYFPLILIVILPSISSIASTIFHKEKDNHLYANVPFVFTAILFLLTITAIVSFSGLQKDVLDGFLLTIESQRAYTGGFLNRTLNWLQDLLYFTKYSLPLIFAVILTLLSFIPQKISNIKSILQSAITTILLIGFLYFLINKSQGVSWFYNFVYSFAVLISFVVLIINNNIKSLNKNCAKWNKIVNLGISWSLFLSFIFGVSSGAGLRNSLLGFTPLFTIGIISIFRIVETYILANNLKNYSNVVWPLVFFIVPLFFLITSINSAYGNIYREAPVQMLTKKFTHPKLKGIKSTPKKVQAVEELLNYLQSRVKKGEFFLAYNYVPMLYFLTHTRPSYRTVWARDDWSITQQKNMLNYMTINNRVPEYCVRMLAFPAGYWSVPMSYDENSPLDSFVTSNFILEKMIYPFEVWHKGQGPKYKIYHKMKPIFESSFQNWNGPKIVNMHKISEIHPPLMLQGNRGEFTFTRKKYNNEMMLRISPAINNQSERLEIQFGYSLNKNGFHFDIHQGQEIIIILSARLSDIPLKTTSLFIQDKTHNWEKNSVAIANKSWEEIIVSKKVRPGFSDLLLGINWQPHNKNQWLEIKKISVIAKNQK